MTPKKLLVLDVNGLLVDTYFHKEPLPEESPDGRVGNFYVYKRPFCDEFLQFCLDNFMVGIWSSAREHNVNNLVDYVFGDSKEKLAFSWHQSDCTDVGLKAPDNQWKPLFLKELSKLWRKVKVGLPWSEGDYGPSNTLLVDDTPYKAILNPPNTAIFPRSYTARDHGDNFLGDSLRSYLEGIRDAASVQIYVESNPFGEPSITPESPLWSYVGQVLLKVQSVLNEVGDDLAQVLPDEAVCEEVNKREKHKRRRHRKHSHYSDPLQLENNHTQSSDNLPSEAVELQSSENMLQPLRRGVQSCDPTTTTYQQVKSAASLDSQEIGGMPLDNLPSGAVELQSSENMPAEPLRRGAQSCDPTTTYQQVKAAASLDSQEIGGMPLDNLPSEAIELQSSENMPQPLRRGAYQQVKAAASLDSQEMGGMPLDGTERSVWPERSEQSNLHIPDSNLVVQSHARRGNLNGKRRRRDFAHRDEFGKVDGGGSSSNLGHHRFEQRAVYEDSSVWPERTEQWNWSRDVQSHARRDNLKWKRRRPDFANRDEFGKVDGGDLSSNLGHHGFEQRAVYESSSVWPERTEQLNLHIPDSNLAVQYHARRDNLKRRRHDFANREAGVANQLHRNVRAFNQQYRGETGASRQQYRSVQPYHDTPPTHMQEFPYHDTWPKHTQEWPYHDTWPKHRQEWPSMEFSKNRQSQEGYHDTRPKHRQEWPSMELSRNRQSQEGYHDTRPKHRPSMEFSRTRQSHEGYHDTRPKHRQEWSSMEFSRNRQSQEGRNL